MPVVLGPNFTVDQVVSLVQLGASLPTAPTLFTGNNIISLLDEEMRAKIIPLVKTLNEEFWVVDDDQQIVSGQTSYQINYRAAASALRDVVLVDNNGNELKMVRYEPEDVKFPMIPYGSPYFPLGFYLKNNAVVLFPTIASQYTTYTLRLKMERRPNSLTSNSNCGQITSIDTNAGTVDLTFIPSTWTAGTTTIDVINNIPPFSSVEDDALITDISGLTVEINNGTLPDGLAINQWIAQSMETPIPQIPYECFPILSQLGILRCLISLGDTAGIERAQRELEFKEDAFRQMMTPRVEGTPKILSGRGGVFDWGRNSWGNWGGF